jgi:hypothetical protein
MKGHRVIAATGINHDIRRVNIPERMIKPENGVLGVGICDIRPSGSLVA